MRLSKKPCGHSVFSVHRLPGMESMPGQLRDAGRDASSPSAGSKQDAPSFSGPPGSLKPNQVSETSLYGVPIVCLVIDGKERLCLAQISNTLLKNYSYNEIHNRRVALGITCVQCTPVQLELLRRAGAMPISSRRCGMITKREAERLCKSFLGAHSPPKLPENFAFDVSHECAWGCRGNFIPTRYNSSRAKCIKCSFCNMYFSPNKFIFHSHRTSESKYLQPDAANFNSWRRHLKLTEPKSDDEVYAWEDVKAMFNGGSRKRTLPMSSSAASASMKAQAASSLTRASPEIPHKSLRCVEDQGSSASLSLAGGTRTYPVIPVPSKNFGMLQKIPPPLFPHHPYGFPGYGLCPKKSDGVADASKVGGSPGVFWPGPKDTLYPAFSMFWPTAGGLPMPPYPSSPPKPHPELPAIRQAELDLSEQSDRGAHTPKEAHDAGERCSSSSQSSSTTRNDEDKSGDETSQRKMSYISAFRPVVKDAESIAKLYGSREGYGVRPGYMSPDFISESSSYRSASPERESVADDDDDDDEDPDVDVESNRGPDEDEAVHVSPGAERQDSPVSERLSVGAEESHERSDGAGTSPERCGSPEDEDGDGRMRNGSPVREVYAHEKGGHVIQDEHPSSVSKQTIRNNGVIHMTDVHSQRTAASQQELKSRQADGALRIDISVHENDLENMAKEELQKQLMEQVELRKKLEREFQHLKDNFQDQMKRELSYREEMVQQLQIVRAHDALHHFSCKMLTPRQCSGACTFKPPLLPP
ncbi:SKI family transcriptional corepressor 1 homolog-B-like isoform X2 [Nelusetta ayraudi]|uniref:SKI family transcriptional corepressor 1 homolog-B-like isoform X2 n=1 Tax=Nelusetta ayraudi TaxID=303726 RepID=UPI003F70A416